MISDRWQGDASYDRTGLVELGCGWPRGRRFVVTTGAAMAQAWRSVVSCGSTVQTAPRARQTDRAAGTLRVPVNSASGVTMGRSQCPGPSQGDDARRAASRQAGAEHCPGRYRPKKADAAAARRVPVRAGAANAHLRSAGTCRPARSSKSPNGVIPIASSGGTGITASPSSSRWPGCFATPAEGRHALPWRRRERDPPATRPSETTTTRVVHSLQASIRKRRRVSAGCCN